MANRIPPDSIVLGAATVLNYDRQPVHAGPDYIYTTHTLRVRGLFNPLLTSSTQANPLQAPVARRGFRAPETDVALRHYLAQPRRQLNLAVGPHTLLQSPRPGFTVDAANGPFVSVNSVAQISGTKTFVVDLTVQTHVAEQYLFAAEPSVMLAHRWQMSHDTDQDFFSTRIIQGYAVFNTERLVQLGASADDFRAYLFHPIPNGFQRVSVRPVLHDGNDRVSYTITDRERSHSLGAKARAANVTRIECTASSSISKKDVFAQSIGVGAESARILRRALAEGAQAGGMAAGATGLPQGAAAAAAGVEILWAMAKNIPVETQAIVCRVWGNRNATRAGLRGVAQAIVENRIANLPFMTGATVAGYNDDVMGKYVECHVQVTAPPIKQAVQDLAVGGDFVRPLFPAAPGRMPADTEDIAGYIGTGLQPQPSPPSTGPWGAVAADAGARGTYVESLVSAALLAPNATPARPTATPVATSRTPPLGA